MTKPRQRARSSDPATSHAAARDLVRSRSILSAQARALEVLRANPGSTARELDTLAGTLDGAIRKRLNDLFLEGLATKKGERKCTITGKTAQLWWPVKRKRK